MRYLLCLALFLLAACQSGAPGSTSEPVYTDAVIHVLKERDARTTSTFRPGDDIRIVLDSNPTTGYSWQLTKNDDGILEAGKSSYVGDAHPPGMVGVGGKETFPFKALKNGTTTVRLTYRRPWKGSEADRPLTFKIFVR